MSGAALGGRGESLRLGGVRSRSQRVRIEALNKCALISRIKSSKNKDLFGALGTTVWETQIPDDLIICGILKKKKVYS